MGLGEGEVNLAVAGLAGVGREVGNVAVMAIVASEWISCRCTLVSTQ
jgi:hypothetical protein